MHDGKGFDEVKAGEVFAGCILAAATDRVLELTELQRSRVFNLGYHTWVEQQGVSLADFEARRSQSFWRSIRASLPEWDRLIGEFNREVRH